MALMLFMPHMYNHAWLWNALPSLPEDAVSKGLERFLGALVVSLTKRLEGREFGMTNNPQWTTALPLAFQHFYPNGSVDLAKKISKARDDLRQDKTIWSYLEAEDEFFLTGKYERSLYESVNPAPANGSTKDSARLNESGGTSSHFNNSSSENLSSLNETVLDRLEKFDDDEWFAMYSGVILSRDKLQRLHCYAVKYETHYDKKTRKDQQERGDDLVWDVYFRRFQAAETPLKRLERLDPLLCSSDPEKMEIVVDLLFELWIEIEEEKDRKEEEEERGGEEDEEEEESEEEIIARFTSLPGASLRRTVDTNTVAIKAMWKYLENNADRLKDYLFMPR